MKSAFKNKFTYLLGIPLGILGAGIPFLIWGICKLCGYDSFPYYIVLASIAFLYYMIGLLLADIGELKYRKKNDLVLESSVPVEVHQAFQNKKAPFFIGAFMVIIALAVVALIFVFAHQWPLLPEAV